MKDQKKKLPTIKYLQGKVWDECKRIIRAYYGNECVACGTKVYGSQLHTGHMFKEANLPMQMKYDLRLLRPECLRCNKFLNGNESWYMANVIRQQGGQYILDIVDDIEFYKKEELDTKQKRDFLENLLEKYKQM